MTDLSVDASLLAAHWERSFDKAPSNRQVVAIAFVLLSGGALALAATYSWRQAALFVLGGALGLVLYHALFGFTSAWRVLIADGRGAGLRAQMLMLAVAAILFFPTLAHGTLLGQPVHGEYGAVGLSVLVGAFLFGVGMQLGGGCASGTLYTVGGGNTRMLVTLAAFIAGSALGAFHLPWWSAQPNIGTVSLIDIFGWAPALTISLALFAAIAALTVWIEKRRHGQLGGGVGVRHNRWQRLLQGPWPPWLAPSLLPSEILQRSISPGDRGVSPLRSRCGVQNSWRQLALMWHRGATGSLRPARRRCSKVSSLTLPLSWTSASFLVR